MKIKKPGLIFLTFFSFLLLDLLSKFIARTNIEPGAVVNIFPGFNLTNIINTGALFGIFSGMNTIIGWVTIFVIGVLLYLNKEFTKSKLNSFFYSLLLAGIVGNLIDRVVFGGVLDFISVLNWPSFNFADASATIAIIGLFWLSFKKK